MSNGIGLGKDGKFGNFDLSKLKGNIDISKLSEASRKIANIFDKNNDGKLQQSELQTLIQQVEKNSKDDNNVSEAESASIFSKLNNGSVAGEIKGEDGLAFLQELSAQKENIKTVTQNGNTTIIEYKPDENGNVVKEYYNGDALISRTTKTRDFKFIRETYKDGQLTTKETIGDGVTKETYENGQLKETSFFKNGVTEYKDSNGNLIKKETLLSNPPGSTQIEYFDEKGQVTKIEIKDNQNYTTSTTEIEYDASGQETKRTNKDGNGNVTSRTYAETDNDGNIVKQKITNSDGSVVEYDPTTKIKTTTYPNGLKIIENTETGEETVDTSAYDKNNAELAQMMEEHNKNWKEGSEISAALYKDMKGMYTSSTFDEHLNQITEDNVSSVVLSFRNVNKKESIAECILDEDGMDAKKRLQAVEDIFNKLIAKAESLNIDTSNYKKEFNKTKQGLIYTHTVTTGEYVNGQYKGGTKTVTSVKIPWNFEGFDKIIEGLAAAIEGASNLTTAERTAVANMSTEEQIDFTNEQLSNVAAESRESFNRQLSQEGWASDVANGVSRLWGSENRPKFVAADLDKFDAQLEELKNCKTEAEFKAKFKEIFGVDYDPELVIAYEKQHKAQQEANNVYGSEQYFNTAMKDVLENSFVNDDISYHDGRNFSVTRSAESKYEEYFYNLVDMLSSEYASPDEAKRAIEAKMSDIGITSSSTTQQKYTALRKIVQEYSEQLHQNTLDATNGEGYEAFTKKSQRMYTAAFGSTNDIAERVQEYNRSTQIGEAVVKGVAKTGVIIVATALTGGAAPVLAGGALTAGALTATGSATIDILDRVTSDDGLQDGQIAEILKSAAIDGACVFGAASIGKVVKEIRNVSNTIIKATEVGGKSAVYTAKDAINGQITIDGVILNVVFSRTGNIKNISVAGKAVASEIYTGAKLFHKLT